jgi:hypothetical protein
MHANYLIRRYTVRRKTRLRHAPYQQNIFTHPQFVTASRRNRAALPYAFTEQGVAMLSLERDVQIVIKEAPRRRTEGKLTVVVA